MICKSLAVHRIFLFQNGLAQARRWPVAKQVGLLRNTATLQAGRKIYSYLLSLPYLPVVFDLP